MAFGQHFDTVKAGDRPSAKEWNKLTRLVEQMASSLMSNGLFSPGTGFLTRRPLGGGGGLLKWVRCDEDAGADNEISCFLIDSNGDDTGSAFIVKGEILNTGTALNTAVPRLSEDDLALITKKGDEWYFALPFDNDEECECSPAVYDEILMSDGGTVGTSGGAAEFTFNSTGSTIDAAGDLILGDNVALTGGNKMTFGDAALGMYSQADSFVDLFADGAVRIGDSSAGAPTNYTKFDPDGSPVFVGTAGLAFAGISAFDVNDTLTISGTGIANKVQVTSFNADDASNNTTPDHTNDHITIVNAGMYFCSVQMTVESAAGATFKAAAGVFKNNGATHFTNLHFHRQLAGGGGDTGSTHMSGFIDLAASDTIEVWVWNETNTVDIIVDDITMSLLQVGGT